MIRLAFFSPYPSDSCSFYRGAGPLSLLPGVTMNLLEGRVSWPIISQSDVLWMQRPYNQDHLDLLKLAQQQIPVICDYDDALLHVPPSNPSYELYSDPKVRSAIEQIISRADATVFSTQECAESFGLEHKIIPNAHNDYWFSDEQPSEPRNKTIYWRGSNTHQEDLQYFAPEIIEVARANPEWCWVFQGMVPWFLRGKIPLEYRTAVDHWEYHRALRDIIRPSVMIVPLVDNKFNRAKSNISWIEGTMAGARVVCPRWLVHDGRGYADPQWFGDHILAAMQEPTPSPVESVPMLSEINKQRLTLLESLV